MLRTSFQCSLVVFAFASLLVQGLQAPSESDHKPQTVEAAPNKSLPIADEPAAGQSDANSLPAVKQNASAEINSDKKEIGVEPGDTSKPGQKIEESSTNPTLTSTTEKPVTMASTHSSSITESTESTTPDSTTPTTIASSTTMTEKSESPAATTTTTTTSNSTDAAPGVTTETTNIAETTTQTISSTPKEAAQSSTAADKPAEGMPSGIIALVMAMAFAVVVIIVYAGLLLWRRYLEYRYGNRELLVNDLEFDTNDLRHFEL